MPKPKNDKNADGTRRRFRRALRKLVTPSRGFILILVVGALSVLTVLGLSFTEQSRASLYGASNSGDQFTVDTMGESGFEMAKRILADDKNVYSTATAAGWNFAEDGVGHTSRWAYNTNYVMSVANNYGAGVSTPSGTQADPAKVPNDPYGGQQPTSPFNYQLGHEKSFLDSWQTMVWNEEPLNNNLGYAYLFKFDGTTAGFPSYTDPVTHIKYTYSPTKTTFPERRPSDPRLLLDAWAYQPFARAKKFKVRSGQNYGVIQIAITPRDGGINVNDVYDPPNMPGGPVLAERWGYHDWLWYNNTTNQGDAKACPDRRTLEYILGRRPEYASMHAEYFSYDGTPNPAPRTPAKIQPGTGTPNLTPSPTYDKYQFVANEPAGSIYDDNGVYNFRGIIEPMGRNYKLATNMPADTTPLYPTYPASATVGKLTQVNTSEPVPFWGANWKTFSRYSYEAPRYPLWVAMEGPSLRAESTVPTVAGNANFGKWNQRLTPSFNGTAYDNARWYPTGRGWADPKWNGTSPINMNSLAAVFTTPDFLFQGFGFDLNNPKRSGISSPGLPGDTMQYVTDDDYAPIGGVSNYHYNGAGMYGHPVPHSFQGHFIPSVALGRFWTDLMADWYFGGSPGYTNKLGKWPDEAHIDNWAFIGSAYDSLGLGTHRMPPTAHIWMPGFFTDNGGLDPYEVQCGMATSPRNMPPAKPAATYTHPLNKFGDDLVRSSPHYQFAGQRNMIRAYGYQEDWNPAGTVKQAMFPGLANTPQMYDAININVAPYEVVYGLLTPEKIPSMMQRTVVAPHLHWKARYFDGAYDGMDWYARYTPTGNPNSPNPNFSGPGAAPQSFPDTPYMPLKDYTPATTPGTGKPPAPYSGPIYPNAPCDTQGLFTGGPGSVQSGPTAMGQYGANPAGGVDAPSSTSSGGTSINDSVAATPPTPTANNVQLTIPAGVKGVPYRFGSIDYWGNFQEFKMDANVPLDTGGATPALAGPDTPWNKVATAKFVGSWGGAGVATYFRVMGPAPFNRSIHKQYEPPALPGNWDYNFNISPQLGGQWSPEKAYTGGTPSVNPKFGVGAVLNRMDFRTPEPQFYYRFEAVDVPGGGGWAGWPSGAASFVAPPWPDPTVAGCYQMVQYKCGTNEPQDDVFVDCHYNLYLSPNTRNGTGTTFTKDKLDGSGPSFANSFMICRPNFKTDFADIYAQRLCEMPNKLMNSGSYYMPEVNPVSGIPNNTVPTAGGPTAYSEGRAIAPGAYKNFVGAPFNTYCATRNAASAGAPNPVVLHPYYGLPNPDYLLLYPEAPPSIHWADQFRRYFPSVKITPLGATTLVGGPDFGAAEYPDFTGPLGNAATSTGQKALNKDPDVQDFNLAPFTTSWHAGPPPMDKLIDDVSDINYPFIQPQIPTPKSDYPFMKAPFVPGVDKDNAWRITRCGRKYQEIIADEIMDYQVNPWWPNPVSHFTEMAVPLDMRNYPSDTRVSDATSISPPGVGYISPASQAGWALNYLNDTPKSCSSMFWTSYNIYVTQGNIGDQIPDYFAYFNRFWVRSNQFYSRDNTMSYPVANVGVRQNDYRAGYPYGLDKNNATESRGKYPSTFQYWGVWYNNYAAGALSGYWQDNIRDFPENTVEDQIGCEFRYLVTAARPVYDKPGSETNNPNGYTPAAPVGSVAFPAAQMAAAPGRNHPFKSWADFVAMLGHLVYRSPLTVKVAAPNKFGAVIDWTASRSTRVAYGIRDRILGVNAWAVCHSIYADARNQGQFFDGSKIANGNFQAAIPDALQGYYGYNAGDAITTGAGGRGKSQAIVAIDGFWPISGNLGAMPDPSGGAHLKPEDMLYPPRPIGMFADNSPGGPRLLNPGNPSMRADNDLFTDPDWEWKRRVDEWRGCDAAGLRVEHQYISERAANDILVSLSNGQIGPIDFDGDGHITMTRTQEVNTGAAGTAYENPSTTTPNYKNIGYWPCYPYHAPTGVLSICEYKTGFPAMGAQPTAPAAAGAIASPAGTSLQYGVLVNSYNHWTRANVDDVINNCVTLPIKFRSNTFRVTVSVELTDKKYQNISSAHKYQRVYSRVTGAPAGASKVQGPYTGEFILHGSRAIDGVDPENSWLGADFGSE